MQRSLEYPWFSIILFSVISYLVLIKEGFLRGGIMISSMLAVIALSTYIQNIFEYKSSEYQRAILVYIYLSGTLILILPIIFAPILPSYIPKISFVLGTYLLCLALLFKRTMRPVIKSGDSLEEQIRSDLNIVAVSKVKQFPKGLRWIGGFITPAAPFFFILNKNWKKNLSTEALIHENVHLYYIQNGAFLVFFFGIFIISFILNMFTKILDYVAPEVVGVIYSTIMLTLFEYLTFKKTKDYAARFNLPARDWSYKICIKYICIYILQFMVILLIFNSIGYLVGLI